MSPPFAFPVSPTRMDLAGDSSGAGVTTAGFVLAPVLAVETGFFAGVITGAAGLVLAPVITGAAAPVSTGLALARLPRSERVLVNESSARTVSWWSSARRRWQRAVFFASFTWRSATWSAAAFGSAHARTFVVRSATFARLPRCSLAIDRTSAWASVHAPTAASNAAVASALIPPNTVEAWSAARRYVAFAALNARSRASSAFCMASAASSRVLLTTVSLWNTALAASARPAVFLTRILAPACSRVVAFTTRSRSGLVAFACAIFDRLSAVALLSLTCASDASRAAVASSTSFFCAALTVDTACSLQLMVPSSIAWCCTDPTSAAATCRCVSVAAS